MICGNLPKIISHTIIEKPKKDIRILYLPIKMANIKGIRIPEEYKFITPLLKDVVRENDITNKYLYLTIDCTNVKAGTSQRRQGWHCDGYLSDDINIIYYTCNATEFTTDRLDLPDNHEDCIRVLNEYEYQNIYAYPAYTLIQMDQKVIHRATIAEKDERRLFVKFSISKEQYNLKGNTHNQLFNYNWTMYDRALVRNHPVFKMSDYFKEIT